MSRRRRAWGIASIGALAVAVLAGCSANSGPSSADAGGVDAGSGSGSGSGAGGVAHAPVVNFEMRPASIKQGETSAAVWTTSGATACSASGAWRGAVQLNNPRGTTIGPITTAGTYTYGMSCTGPGGTTVVSNALGVGAVPAPTIQLTLTPSSVTPGSGTVITWSTTNATTCTANGGTGTDHWVGSKALANPTGFNVAAISTAGEYNYDLTCTGTGGVTEQSALLSVSAAAPPAPPTVTFAAQPTLILPGQATSFSWTTNNATSCAASGGSGADAWSGTQPTSSGGTSSGPVATPGAYSYTLTCAGPGGSTAKSVTVVVSTQPTPPAPSVSIDAIPATLVAGRSASLTWSSTNADACTASGSWSGSEPTQGSSVSTGTLTAPGGTPTNYSYTLVCTGTGGSATDTASVLVNPAAAVITHFTANPAAITNGQSTMLSWTTTGATSCTASGGASGDGWGGPVPVSSPGTAVGPISSSGYSVVYTLSCTGPGGLSTPQSLSVLVNAVAPPAASITSLTASPATLVVGQSTSLAWSSSSATSCSASGGSGADNWMGPVGTSSGGMTVGPINSAGNYAYTLVCMGPGGASAPTSVTVDVAGAPPVPTIGSFTASPTAVQTGQSTSLAWSSSGATSCTASGGTGADGWSGSQPVASTGTAVGPINGNGTETYTLTCNGAGGTSTPSSVSVTVTPTPPAATIGNFSATPASLQAGSASSLRWSSSNADSCTAGGGTGSDGWGGQVATSSTGTSTGALTVGTYTYTLTCSGPGGSSAASSALVTVTTAPPPAGIASFTATPNQVTVGQSTQLTWSTSAATSCAASGGTGSDGWNGSKPASSSGTTVGPINAAGNYVYTLVCTGAGGDSAPESVNVTVTAPVAASIQAFAATPNSLTAGQSASLSWSSSAATSCTAGGGTGSDGWIGAKATSSTGTSTGPLSTAGSVTYTLTCTGPGGTSAPSSTSVTVHAVVPVQPAVTLLANGGSTATVLAGSTVTFSWSSSNATSCSASGGSASDWSGTKAVSNSGVLVGPVSSTPGIYAYTLTCSGPGGSGSGTVQLTIMPPNGSDCGVGVPTTDLVGPNASATGVVSSGPLGLLCLGCSVSNPGSVVDTPTNNYATITQPVGVLGSTSLTVTGTTTYPAGRKVGFVVAEGNGLLSATVLQGLTVETLMNGVVQESAAANGLLGLDALGLIAVNPQAGFVDFTTTKPFNSVALVAGSVASVLGTYKVYDACVTLQ